MKLVRLVCRRAAAGAVILASSALVLSACSASESTETATGTTAADGTLDIYATTGYLADAIKNIAPDANVKTLVGPGGDPHTYQPSTKDIEEIQSSDLVFWNGLYLEAQMETQLSSLGEKQLAVGEELPKDVLLDWPETRDNGQKLYDPHVWNSPEAWTMVVESIAEKLADVDPDNAQTYQDNARAYIAEIDAAVAEAHELLAQDSIDPRILVTGHDAFNYFGQTFDLEIHATDFISTESQLSATELSELADLIVEKKIPTIFMDNQVNPQAITSLQEAVSSRGWDVTISDEELFADSLGATAPTDTYVGALKHNANTVAEGLSASK